MPDTTDRPRRKSVVDGVVQFTSVSQMQKADETTGGCLRAWYYNKVLGLPDAPPSKGQKRGIEGHGRIAKYLTEALDVLDPLEALGKKYLPAPKSGALVEHPIGGGLYALDVPVIGFVDLAEPQRVTDFKFKAKRSIEGWPTAPADLSSGLTAAGIQMTGYGVWLSRAYPAAGWTEIELRHLVFQTEGPREVFPVSTVARLDLINNSWQSACERTIPKMKEAAKAASAFDVKPNHGACFYKGSTRPRCPYVGQCLDPMARLKASLHATTKTERKEETKMGMLSSIIGTKNGVTIPSNAPVQVAATPAQTPSPTPPAVPTPAPAPSLIKDEQPSAQIAAKTCTQGQQYSVNGVDATFLCLTKFGTAEFASFTPIKGGTPILIPPDQAVGAYGAPAAAPTPAPHAVPPPAPVAVAPPAAAPTPAPPQAVQAPAEAPKKRGRKPKEATSAEAPEEIGGVRIYQGCAPIGVELTNLSAYVDELQERLFEVVKKGDPSFIPPDDLRLAEGNVIGFGKWKAYLGGVAQEAPPAPGHYVALKGDERVEVVVAALAKALPAGSVTIG